MEKSYLSPKIKAQKSKIGNGLFATDLIKKDELIIDWQDGPGVLLTTQEAYRYEASGNKYTLQVDDNRHLVSVLEVEDCDYINHSCDPNGGIRNPTPEDAKEICMLEEKAYPTMPAYEESVVIGQINAFPEGHFIAIYENRIVGYAAAFQINGDIALKPHTWKEITGGGYASRHDPFGDYLYGMDICVDPDLRGLRIGQRFYNERKKLCRHLRLKGIVIGGRIPGLSKKIKNIGSPEEYIKSVETKKIRDQVLSFQLRNGFEIIGVLQDYLPYDQDSLGYAVHMVWKNPSETAKKSSKERASVTHIPDTIRVAAIQYGQRKVDSFEQFCKYVEYFVDVVSDYKSDFVVFPELFTFQLLSIEEKAIKPIEAMDVLNAYTQRFTKFMSALAIRYNINIIGGSHPTKNKDNETHNICYIFLRDGSIHQQAKIHATPNERYWWNIKGGNEAHPIMTDCGPIGVLICYDSEFPELARHLVDQGAQILFVPFCTDTRQSYLRVRYSAQARAVENQCFVVMAGNVGNLPGVENMDIQYSQSCILTPCDFMFARDGIAADTTPNVETVAVADIRIENLLAARASGSVQNLKDRRFDLYTVNWQSKKTNS